MPEKELCTNCDEPTGKAGRLDDSLFLSVEGPYCEECYADRVPEIADERYVAGEQLRVAQARIAEMEAENARLLAALVVARQDMSGLLVHLPDQSREPIRRLNHTIDLARKKGGPDA